MLLRQSRRGSLLESSKIGLPPEYMRVEYLESTGTQWIDTGFKPNNNTSIDISFKYLSFDSSTKFFYGASNSSWSGKSYGLCTYSSNQQFYGYANSDEGVGYCATAVTKYTIKRNKNILTIYNNIGTLLHTKTFSSNTFQCDYNLYIFASNWTNSACGSSSIQVYSCDIYDNGKKIRYLVPCYRLSDSKPGMYDIVTDTFFVNQGTGEFLVGKDMPELPEEYQMVEYLESTGVQWIDTEVTPNSLYYTTEVKIELTTTIQELIIIGNQTSASYYHITPYRNSWYYGNNGYERNAGTIQPVVGDKYIIEYNKNQSIYINGEEIASNIEANTLNDNTILISKRGRFYGRYKYFYAKIYTNEQIIRYLIPCYRISDHKPGMFDLVTRKFFVNQGTGEFLVGSDKFNLPSEYQQVDYIKGDGNSYINSLYTPNFLTSKIEAGYINFSEINRTNYSPSDQYLFGVSMGGHPTYFELFPTSGGSVKLFSGIYGEISVSDPAPSGTTTNTLHRVVLSSSGTSINGILTATNNHNTSGTSSDIYLLACHTSSGVTYTNANQGLTYMKIWENRNLVKCYVPCYRVSDTTIGVYELISGTFLTNSGSGSFTKGNDIS